MQVGALSPLKSESLLQLRQSDDPVAACVPAVHAVTTLLPTQREPAGHAPHESRSAVPVPPDVYEPGGHTLQLEAPAALYCVSLPHGQLPSTGVSPPQVPQSPGDRFDLWAMRLCGPWHVDGPLAPVREHRFHVLSRGSHCTTMPECFWDTNSEKPEYVSPEST